MKRRYVRIEEAASLTPAQIAAVADIYASDGECSDPLAAASFYRAAAERGNAYAQRRLADAYASGIGVEKNGEWALYWYMRAAEQENPYAQYQVALRVADADGALLWLHLSAKQGFPCAMKELADRLLSIDPKRSSRWLRRYYRTKNKCTPKQIDGRSARRPRKSCMPQVRNGEVVIRI